MYAHHVIEDFKRMLRSGKINSQMYMGGLKLVMAKIKSSKQFYLGEYQELKIPRETTLTDNTALFLNDASPFTRLPYKCCWFEFTNTFKDLTIEEDVPKRGMLAIEIQPDVIWVWIVNYAKVLGMWALSPQSYYITIGKTLSEEPMLIEMILQMNPSLLANEQIAKSNVFPVPCDLVDSKGRAELCKDDQRDLYVLNSALILLNCKNIETEDNRPSGKINKKRKKKGKQELFTYKTLRLNLPATRNVKDGSDQKSEEENKRIHLCRGHFKIYTEQNPLFGKHTGVYWWQPHLRGDKHSGLVDKDYTVTTNT